MRKKLLALALAAVLVISLAACSGSKDSGDGGSKGGGEKELKVQIGPNPETIDPALNSAVDGGNLILHAFECLLTVGQDGSLQPGCAETWETSEDGLTWTFHLRDGLKWSDGSDLTAEDFVYSWKRVCDPAVAAPYAETVLGMVDGYDEAIKGDLDELDVKAPDASTFVVEMDKPCTYFGSLAAFATLSPVQKATIEANGDAWATAPETYISNGPFYMTEWEPGSHITFTKNPYYWNADAIKLDKLTFALIEDSNAAYSAYQTDEVSFIKDVPTEEIPSLQGNPEYHVDTLMGTYYLNLNCEKDLFKDPRVRKALSLAVDRKYVAETIMQGTYTAAPNFIGPGWVDTDGSQFMDNANGGKPYIDVDNHEANVAEAKKLLAEAGYPDGKGFPKFEYNTNDSAYHKPVAEYLQQAWGELGINMEVKIVEWASFTPLRRNGQYEAARNGWAADYNDPSNQLDIFYSSNGNNDGKFENEEFDKAMDESRATVDPAARSAALHKAEDVMMEEAACIPLAYYNDFWLEKPNVKGIWHSAYGYWYFMNADIEQ